MQRRTYHWDRTVYSHWKLAFQNILRLQTQTCEAPIDVHDVEKEDLSDSEPMEEKPWSWADETDAEADKIVHQPNDIFYDDVTGKILKYEKVIAARLDEIEALKKMWSQNVIKTAEIINPPILKCAT